MVEQSGLDGRAAGVEESDEVCEGDGEGFAAGTGIRGWLWRLQRSVPGLRIETRGTRRLRSVEGDAAEAAGIDEADFAMVCFPRRTTKSEDSVGVGRERDFRRGDEQATGHTEVDEEFGGCFIALHSHDDGFADAVDGLDEGSGEGGGDLGLGRLEGLRLAAGPDTGDAGAVAAGVDACGDGFDFGKLRHRD